VEGPLRWQKRSSDRGVNGQIGQSCFSFFLRLGGKRDTEEKNPAGVLRREEGREEALGCAGSPSRAAGCLQLMRDLSQDAAAATAAFLSAGAVSEGWGVQQGARFPSTWA